MKWNLLASVCALLFCGTVLTSGTAIEPKEKTNLGDEVEPSFIVPDDGSVAAAFKAAEERKDTSARFIIYIRDGKYMLTGDSGDSIEVEGVKHPSPMTTLSAPNVTIVGESMEGVILTNKPIHEGISITATLRLAPESRNTEIRNLTILNGYNYNDRQFAGRAVALQDKSTGTRCKNVVLLSNQDTYYSNNNEGIFYFEDCEIHGTVDFICGGGDATFLRCRLVLEDRKNGDCITAPGVPLKNGYVFRDCIIDGPESQNKRFSLGRPWKNGSRCQYINTRMNILPRKEGWTVMRDYVLPVRMAEYGSVDVSGVAIDLSERRSVWGPDSAKVNISPILTKKEAESLLK